jgi:hypothetical protein
MQGKQVRGEGCAQRAISRDLDAKSPTILLKSLDQSLIRAIIDKQTL